VNALASSIRSLAGTDGRLPVRIVSAAQHCNGESGLAWSATGNGTGLALTWTETADAPIGAAVRLAGK